MKRDMNFFSTSQGIKKEAKDKKIYIYSLVVFLAIVIIGTLAWNSINLHLTGKEIDDYTAKLEATDIQQKLTEFKEATIKTNALNKYESDLKIIAEAVDSKDVVNTKLLNEISSTLPTEVSFDTISITNSVITMQAKASNRTSIGEIEHNLKELAFIQDVYIGGIAGDTEYTFDLKCTLKDVD
ncbi:PilN domain-containing protein [Clostridium vincentii]|uniref:Fimbrial assembly protein n=1 Tax=Clostridium vincentii TaxID=52704 RepID=A0A2T0BC38_9CLOT|nr:PilN domain-containing protein [Clostridium vincentii]PRR81454.1 Fimbrial assembly protein [Clostridium vincentii]